MVPEWTKQTAAVMNGQGYTFKELVSHDFSRQRNLPYIHGGCSINDQGGSSLLAVSNRNSMPSLVDLERMSGGIVYPEQMSSQWCYDMRPSGGGLTFSGTFSNPSSGYSNWIRHGELVENNQAFNHVGALSSSSDITDPSRYAGLLSNWVPKDINATLSSSNGFAKPMLRHELVSQCVLQAFQSKQCDSQPCPPPVRVGTFKAQANGFTTCKKNIHNKAHYSGMGPKNTPQQGFCNVQAPKPVVSIRNPQNILVLYLSDKYNIMDACKSRQEFLARLHLAACSGVVCKCKKYLQLISHFDYCRDAPCVTCGPIREFCYKNLYVTNQPFPKRLKMENDDWSLGAIVRQSLKQPSEGLINSAVALNNEIPSDYGFDDKITGNENVIAHCEEINTRVDEQQEMGRVDTGEVRSYGQSLDFDGISILPEEFLMDEAENIKWISEAICDLGDSDCQSGKKLEDLKVSGVSLIDFFTPGQIKEHLHSLNQCVNLPAVNGLNGDMGVRIVDKNTCQLCDVGVRTFAPSPMYCTYCGARIKHGLTYYRPPDDGTNLKYFFCTLCYKASRGGNISFMGLSFSNAILEKCRYTDEFPEGWVQCNKCEAWQHQICALYNSKQDLEGKLDYICPFCRLNEIEAKGHASIPSSFRARDLPRTKLSDHIEQRLSKSLERERKLRADILGKSPEEVTGVEDLVVRVVLSVNKVLKVKKQFLDILHGETYPTEFPYKSKVLMLFQKVEGVDVCIFAMYLQEFGSECGHPNNRSIYISYLDSVKYFRPEIKTVDGVALRTFVYHEILIGYFDYCKQRGFNTCYIWACPPTKGEDYILYCHPETQKTPNPHKLLQWYKKLLGKAKEENVVVEYTNFYDYFFVPSGECNRKITAARLPYFDGDYWSRAIEDMIRVIEQDESGSISGRKSKIKTTKRALRATGRTYHSANETKDILVMQKLGQTILPFKEEFFVVHLQFTCINCRDPILSGSRWSCNQCRRFHLCRRCLEPELSSSGQETHTSIRGEKHELHQIPVNDVVAADTEDEDVVLENDIFDNRQSFLKFCQDNHYQFDSLRRAKHSSMMILHQLQNNTV